MTAVFSQSYGSCGGLSLALFTLPSGSPRRVRNHLCANQV